MGAQRKKGIASFECGSGNTMVIEFPNVKKDKGIIIHYHDKKVKYIPNMPPSEDGNKFNTDIINSLNTIYKTTEGKIVLNSLNNSKNKYHIKQTKFLVSQFSVKKAEFSLGENSEYDKKFKKYIIEKNYSSAKQIVLEVKNLFIGAYIGNYITAWDNHRYDGVKMNLTLALGHELYHAYQFESGIEDNSFIGGYLEKLNNIPLLEVQAVGFENYLRASLFKDTKYYDVRSSYSFSSIKKYMEKPDLWDYLLGFDKLRPKEFLNGGKGYKMWKHEFKTKAKKRGEKI